MALLLVGPLILGKAIANSGFDGFADADTPRTANTVCDVGAMTRHIEKAHIAGGGSATVLAFMDLGPQILYRSRLRVIGTPYHRNGAGILDSHTMLASEDDRAAGALMRARGVDLILLCPDSAERAFYSERDSTNRLYDRLVAGQPPAGLRPVVLPPLLSEAFMLYLVGPPILERRLY